jgi:hypothetical protein
MSACYLSILLLVIVTLFESLVGSLGILSTAEAWDRHESLMPVFLDSYFPKLIQKNPELHFVKNDPLSDPVKLRSLTQEYGLNPQARYPSLSPELDLYHILAKAVDDPDQGMDQDLADALDPHQYRTYMGGKTGPTSQGFRHMLFGGLKVYAPLKTFQFPTGKMGEAQDRFIKFARLSRTLWNQKDPVSKLWSLRTTSWALHYLQDLTQPFHALQVPSLKMVPWTSLFSQLVPETTRTIANYHWAYEGYILWLLENHPERLKQCQPLTLTLSAEPELLIQDVLKFTMEQGDTFGKQVIDLFGTDLKDKRVDLAHHQGNIIYQKISEKKEALPLEKLTCESLDVANRAGYLLFQWVQK